MKSRLLKGSRDTKLLKNADKAILWPIRPFYGLYPKYYTSIPQKEKPRAIFEKVSTRTALSPRLVSVLVNRPEIVFKLQNNLQPPILNMDFFNLELITIKSYWVYSEK